MTNICLCSLLLSQRCILILYLVLCFISYHNNKQHNYVEKKNMVHNALPYKHFYQKRTTSTLTKAIEIKSFSVCCCTYIHSYVFMLLFMMERNKNTIDYFAFFIKNLLITPNQLKTCSHITYKNIQILTMMSTFASDSLLVLLINIQLHTHSLSSHVCKLKWNARM